MNIDEPGINQLLLLLRRDIEPLSKPGVRPVHLDQLGIDRFRLLDRVVVARDPKVRLLDHRPPAGFEMPIDLPVETVPVADSADQDASVDEIKGLVGGPGPLLLDILDVELAVGRHPAGLDGAEIVSDDRCVWERICNIERPDACSSSQVQDPSVRFGCRDGGAE